MKAEFLQIPTRSIFNSSYNGKLPNQYRQAYRDILDETQQCGQLRPVIVRMVGNGQYAVVSGHFIMNAIKECGLATVFCINLGAMSNSEAARRGLELSHQFMCCDLFEISLSISEMESECSIQGLPVPYSEKSIEAIHNAIRINITGPGMEQPRLF